MKSFVAWGFFGQGQNMEDAGDYAKLVAWHPQRSIGRAWLQSQLRLFCFGGGIPDWNYDNYGGFIGTLEYELTINGFIGTFYWDIYKWLRYIGTLEYDYIKTINGFSGHWAWTNILFLFIKVWVSKSDPTVGWSCGPVLQQNKFDLPETTVSTGAKMKGSDWLTYWSWQCYNNPERDNEVHGIAITLLWQICVHFCACEY
jgi:hypothetical protein